MKPYVKLGSHTNTLNSLNPLSLVVFLLKRLEHDSRDNSSTRRDTDEAIITHLSDNHGTLCHRVLQAGRGSWKKGSKVQN